jgi:glycosyltransferase involved in cell wall biosynthesis
VRSIVVPVYRNAESIPELLVALTTLADSLGQLEVVFVVDGSPDNSGELLVNARESLPFSTKIIFHSRNFGSFTAIRTGLEYASSDLLAVMAADLQDPPELITEFFRILEADTADVVFGRRTKRHDPFLTRAPAALFWSLYRWIAPDIPKGGIDTFACNRRVRDAVLEIEEQNSSLVAQLIWVGFRRGFVDYERRARPYGTSGWGFVRRFRYMLDSIFSYSDLPIIVILWSGLVGCAVSVILGLVTVIAKFLGYIEQDGYTTLVLLILFFGSLSLLVQGMTGCYLWRAMENSKRRPLRIVSRVISG